MHATCPRQVTTTEATAGALIHPTPLGGGEDSYPHVTDAETEAQRKRRTQPKERRRGPPTPGFLGVARGLLSHQAADRPLRPWEYQPPHPSTHTAPFLGVSGPKSSQRPPAQGNEGLKSPRHLESSSCDVSAFLQKMAKMTSTEQTKYTTTTKRRLD